jgi:Putative zinc-finger
MDWNCTLTEERLSDFLDQALAPQEAAALSAHTRACGGCAKLLAQVSGLVTQMQQAPQLAEPSRLQRRILDATLGPRKQRAAPQGLFGWLSLIWQPRFAMGIVTVAASFAIVFHAAASPGGRANLNPMNLLRGANRQIHLTYARGARFVNNLRVVYEIESRLSAPPDSLSEPVVPPPARPAIGAPDQQQPDAAPREKSQTIPRSTRRNNRSSPELAVLLPAPGAISNSLQLIPRSFL